MSFKTIDMRKLKENVVARLKMKIKGSFVAECKEEGFEFGVEVGSDGVGSLFVEFYDLMDPFISGATKKTLERLVDRDPNLNYLDSNTTRPSYHDFRIGAMPCVYVMFKLIP